jgi:hypothetical protein
MGRLTEISALLGTPEGGTETTSSPWSTDTVCSTILVVVLTSSNGFQNVASVLSSPFLPKVDGPS